jgi:hypothetical protein
MKFVTKKSNKIYTCKVCGKEIPAKSEYLRVSLPMPESHAEYHVECKPVDAEEKTTRAKKEKMTLAKNSCKPEPVNLDSEIKPEDEIKLTAAQIKALENEGVAELTEKQARKRDEKGHFIKV